MCVCKGGGGAVGLLPREKSRAGNRRHGEGEGRGHRLTVAGI